MTIADREKNYHFLWDKFVCYVDRGIISTLTDFEYYTTAKTHNLGRIIEISKRKHNWRGQLYQDKEK